MTSCTLFYLLELKPVNNVLPPLLHILELKPVNNVLPPLLHILELKLVNNVLLHTGNVTNAFKI